MSQARANTSRTSPLPPLRLGSQEVECRLVRSDAARKLRLRVCPEHVEVVLPTGRELHEALAFAAENLPWLAAQWERARGLRLLRRPVRSSHHVLFRGEPTSVRLLRSARWLAPNKVELDGDAITITLGMHSQTEPSRTLENWFRKLARTRIEHHVELVAKRVKRQPNRVYVMGQRTKWGNCSALGNLSFNWRLIMAPDFVLRYIVTHEVVHLAVPDHSQRFWLTVQSLCPDSDRARQWLVANGHTLTSDLGTVLLHGAVA